MHAVVDGTVLKCEVVDGYILRGIVGDRLYLATEGTVVRKIQVINFSEGKQTIL